VHNGCDNHGWDQFAGAKDTVKGNSNCELLLLSCSRSCMHVSCFPPNVHFGRKVDIIQCQIGQTTGTHQAKGQERIRRQRSDSFRLVSNEPSLEEGTDCHTQYFEISKHDTILKAWNRHDGFL
jgi:hypothetical protein